MEIFNIPEKYAQERSGWKTLYVMKNVYMHTFIKERLAVDDKIDSFFEKAMQHESQHKKISIGTLNIPMLIIKI